MWNKYIALGADCRWLLASPVLTRSILYRCRFTEEECDEVSEEVSRVARIVREATFKKTIGAQTGRRAVDPHRKRTQMLTEYWGLSRSQVDRILSGMDAYENSNSDTAQLARNEQKSSAHTINLYRLFAMSLATGVPQFNIWPETHILAARIASTLLALRRANAPGEQVLKVRLRYQQYNETPYIDEDILTRLSESSATGSMIDADSPAEAMGPARLMLGYGAYLSAMTVVDSESGEQTFADGLDLSAVRSCLSTLKSLLPSYSEQLDEAWISSAILPIAEKVGRALCGMPPYDTPLREEDLEHS